MGITLLIFPILGGVIMLAFPLGIVCGVVWFVKMYKRAKANGDSLAANIYVFTILCVAIMILSWIFNLGWYRVVLSWLLVPVIHSGVFLSINFRAAAKVSCFKSLKKYIIFSGITYLLPYLIFPDGGDVGGMYLFFGLIKNDTVAMVATFITPIVLALNIVALLLQSLELRKCRTPKSIS